MEGDCGGLEFGDEAAEEHDRSAAVEQGGAVMCSRGGEDGEGGGEVDE